MLGAEPLGETIDAKFSKVSLSDIQRYGSEYANGLDEEKIRKYVQWQEKQEKQVEAVQGKLFD